MLENIGRHFGEARVRIEANRAALRAVLDAQGDMESIRQDVARLDRIATVMRGVEEPVNERAVGTMGESG